MSGSSGIYESDQALNEYLLFHYGEAEDQMPWPEGPREAVGFPVRCVTELLPAVNGGVSSGGRALDVGCAVGRSSFELSRHFAEVIGIDHSLRFIGAANRLKSEGELAFRKLEEGDRYAAAVARRPAGTDPGRVHFECGDACNLRPDLGEFDLVLGANLLCRLPDPGSFLKRLKSLVCPGGHAILVTPCTWLEAFTPRSHWLCGKEGTTLEGVHDALADAFELLRTAELPFLIREHARKFQWGMSQGSVWLRR